MLVNLNETSIAKLYDLNLISNFCVKNNMYLIVDMISAFLAEPINFTKDKIDVAIVSSQKALALPPGLSMVVISERIYKERILKNTINTLYLDLNDHIKDMKRGQTPFTPAEGIIFQLGDRVNKILEIGTDKIIENTRKLALNFRKKISEFEEFELPTFKLSNAVTPVICKRENAKYLFEELKNKYEIYITPSGGSLENKLFRVGHMGNLVFDDNVYLIEKIREILR